MNNNFYMFVTIIGLHLALGYLRGFSALSIMSYYEKSSGFRKLDVFSVLRQTHEKAGCELGPTERDRG